MLLSLLYMFDVGMMRVLHCKVCILGAPPECHVPLHVHLTGAGSFSCMVLAGVHASTLYALCVADRHSDLWVKGSAGCCHRSTLLY